MRKITCSVIKISGTRRILNTNRRHIMGFCTCMVSSLQWQPFWNQEYKAPDLIPSINILTKEGPFIPLYKFQLPKEATRRTGKPDHRSTEKRNVTARAFNWHSNIYQWIPRKGPFVNKTALRKMPSGGAKRWTRVHFLQHAHSARFLGCCVIIL